MRISDWSSDVCSSDLLKIRAMSSESKASAYIIGVLPFTVFGLICYINYDYMSPFFTPDPAGLFGLSTMQVIGLGGMCRSEERGVGKECVSTCSARRSQYHQIKNRHCP